jgi:hypothetical protein
MSRKTSSAEGGRSNWQGIRFEAGFAVLNLIRTSLSKPPIGLDALTARTDAAATGADFQFQPQADGAVDDLVAIDNGQRVAAYQLKSGLGTLPKSTKGKSATHEALRQAAGEFAATSGASVVVLAFGSLSSPLRQLAQWLVTGAQPPGPKTLRTLGQFFSKSELEVQDTAFRSRLRIIECGEVSDLVALINLELNTCFSSPQQARSVSDALHELVAKHSDKDGVAEGPITTAVLARHLATRGHPALTSRPSVEAGVLHGIAEQFLANVRSDRGSLPKLARPECVNALDAALEDADVALLGAGGAGKTEVEAQVLEVRLAERWTPVIVRRQDLTASDVPLAEHLGAGGRVTTLDLVHALLQEGRNVFLLVDALDEIRRGSPSTSGPRSQEVYGLLTRIREACPSRERLQILVSSRTSDWEHFARVPLPDPFQEFSVPPLTLDTVLGADVEPAEGDQEGKPADGGDDEGSTPTIAKALARLSPSLALECLARPLLLRFAYELTLAELAIGPSESDDLRSDAELWFAYFARCVTYVDDIPARGFGRADVHRCHDESAIAHIEGQRLYTSIAEARLVAEHDHAYRWMLSLDVLRNHVGSVATSVSFFSASYLDFALANAVQERLDAVESFVVGSTIAIALYPVFQLLPAFWADGDPNRAVERTRRMLSLPAASSLACEAFLDGWVLLDELSDDQRANFVSMLAALPKGSGRTPLTLFFTLVARQPSTNASVRKWLTAATRQLKSFDSNAVHIVMLALADVYRDPKFRPQDGASVARIVDEGFERARSQIASDVYNAATLAEATANLLALCVHDETLQCFVDAPLEVENWPNASNDAANRLASAVRNRLCAREVLVPMAKISPAAAKAFATRIIKGVWRMPESPVNLTRPMQTEMNFIWQPDDVWKTAWTSLSDFAADLVTVSAEFVDAVVLAWQLFGFFQREGKVPEPKEGSFWIPDGSYHWWFEAGQRTNHGEIAEEGFNGISAALRAGDLTPYLRLVEATRRERWAGLVAVLLEIAGDACRSDVSDDIKQTVANVAVQQCLEPQATARQTIRRALREELRALLPHVSTTYSEQLFASFAALANAERIASLPVPESESLEELQAEYDARVEELEARIARRKGKQTSEFFDRDQIQLSLVRSLPPEKLHRMNQSVVALNVSWREQAMTGVSPLDHPDVQFVASVLLRCDFASVSLPPALTALVAAARKAVETKRAEADHAPQLENDDAAIEANEGQSVSIGDDQEPADDRPRVLFVRECDRVASERINQKAPLDASTKERLREQILWSIELAGLDEPSIDHSEAQEEPDASAQPFPKRAWLQLVVAYLDGLQRDEPHGLSEHVIEGILRLATDADPFGRAPASNSYSTAVRVLAARAVVRARAHGSNSDAVDAMIVRLAVDDAPTVRRAFFDAAPLVGHCAPDLYARVLRLFASVEADPFILNWDCEDLFKLYHEDLLKELDASAAIAIPRVAALYAAETVRGFDSERNVFHSAVEELVKVAVKLAANVPLGETARMLRLEMLASPVVASLALEAIFVFVRGGPKNASAFIEILDWIEISVPEGVEDPLLLRERIEQTTHAGASLAASLLNLDRVPGMPLILLREQVDLEALKTSPLWKYREQFRGKWIDVVVPWMSSEFVLSAQRLASDSAFVLDVEARLDPASAANVLGQLRVERAARHFEPKLADQLANLAAYLLLRCDAPGATQQALVALIEALASVGNQRASQAARTFAAFARTYEQ